jgi:hypothetical protein
MRRARTCYDHLAGELGVAVSDAMIERHYVVLDVDAGLLTAKGSNFLSRLGVDLSAPTRSRRTFCRPCLDWSERRPHLAGRVGASIAGLAFERDWIRWRPQGRSVEITGGHRGIPRPVRRANLISDRSLATCRVPERFNACVASTG